MKALTAKQQAFLDAYLKTSRPADAYREAYGQGRMSDNAIRVEASRLLEHPRISLMVQEARAKARTRNDISVDKLTEMAIDAYKLAMKDSVEAPAAAISAVLAIGKLHGLIVDKKEVTRKRDAADLTDDELVALALLGRERVTSPTRGSDEPDRLH